MDYRRSLSEEEEGEDGIANSKDLPAKPDENPDAYRVAKTVAVYVSFFGVGCTVGGYGPTVGHLEILLATDLKTIGVAMIAGVLGYSFGSVGGGILVDRFNPEFLFTLSSLLCGVPYALYPWANEVWMFVVLLVLNGIGSGVIDAGVQPYLLDLWHGTKLKNPLFQALHGIWSIGAMLGPVVMRQFLMPLADQSLACTNSTGYDVINTTEGNTTAEPNCTVNVTIDHSDVEYVRFGFAILGAVDVVGAILFFVIFFLQGPFCRVANTPKEAALEARKKGNKVFRVVLLFMLFWFFMLYVLIENIPGIFSPTMVVKGLNWGVRTASLLASVYWGFHCLGRFLAVPVSTVLTPRQMLVISMILPAVSYLVMSLFAELHDAVMWVTLALGGLGVSCMWGSTVLWASEYIRFDGVASGISVVGYSSGGLVYAPLVTYLSQTYTYMWIAYLPCLAASLAILVYIGMQIFATFSPCKTVVEEAPTAAELQPMKSQNA